MHKGEPKWLVSPPKQGLPIPFIKGIPLKALDNQKMEYEAETPKGKLILVVRQSDTFEMSKGQTYSDMCEMNILNEPEVLRNLIDRYRKDQIFTYIGPTLIVINPYRIIERLFNQQVVSSARQKIMSGNLKGEPHIYMTAGKAFQSLTCGQGKQAIVISGQSGAGKTESTKYCMKMLTSLSHQSSHSIQKKILACNPLLEAFGNSKTVRNDNSSRFGKYVQIFFGQDHTIQGANIISYLLQKSRVVSVAVNERTYHAFYALTASKSYGVKQPQHYKYLKQSNCYTAANINDVSYFKEINTSMDQIGFSKQEQDKIWILVAAILELGNLEFDDKRHQVNQSNGCDIVNKSELAKIAKVFGISADGLEKMLCFQQKIMLKEVSYKAYNKLGCIGNLNTLSKSVYSAIFEFIIFKVQLALNIRTKQELSSINLLDIFGFENFGNNSLEQLCINFTNQKLLKQYNRYVFENQMVILREDGLEKEVRDINPPTNDLIISLLSDKMSLFSIIIDNTPNAQFKDADMMHGFQRDFGKSRHMKFDLINKDQFTIIHSQCEVTYCIDGFKLKNQDRVSLEIQQVYKKLFPNDNKEQSGKTLLSKFTKEIDDLVGELSSAKNHFVRCIKPNEQKKPQIVQENYLLTQVRYLGVFQTIQIRQKTFPARKQYHQFIATFQQIFENAKRKEGRDAVLAILKGMKAKEKQFLLGKKRIYLSKDIDDRLNKALYIFFKIKNQKATKIQRQIKAFVFRKQVLRKLKLLVKRKRLWKKFEQKKRHEMLKKSLQTIYKYSEGIKEEKRIQKMEKEGLLSSVKKEKDTLLAKEKLKKQMQKQKVQTKQLPKLVLSSKNQQNLDQTIIADPLQKPYQKMKKQQKQQQKEGKFNMSFTQGESVIYTSSNPDVIFQKNIILPPHYNQDKEAKWGNLSKLQKVLAEQYKLEISGTEEQFFSPNSQDCTFKIEETPHEEQNKIIHFGAEDFFKRVLRKRTGFFGISKDFDEVLVAKSRPLSKTLTVMEEEDEERALKVFKVLIRIGEEAKLDNVFRLIENMIALCQSTSQQLKNQVFLQLIKQSNNPQELAAIRIYQSMAVFLHIYVPDQDFVYAGLFILNSRLQDQRYSDKEEQYLRYLFKKMLRRIDNPPAIGYMPIKYQLMALMCKRQISIPIYLPVGNSILVRVESYDTFSDIKQRVVKELGINYKRINPDMFRFFEIVNFQNQQLEESPINQNQIVWDIMTYWELAKEKYKEASSPPPAFFLMLKIVYAFEIHPDDVEGIELAFAQCYFDYFIGRIRLEFGPMAALAACVKKVKLANRPEHEIMGAYPIWAAKMFQKEELSTAMIENIRQMEGQGLTILQMKFRFLEVSSQSPLAMAMGVPTDQAIKLYLKPKKIYLAQKSKVLQQFSMRNIQKWAIDKQKFVFDVKGGALKTQVVYTEYAFVCSQYLSQLPKILKRGK